MFFCIKELCWKWVCNVYYDYSFLVMLYSGFINYFINVCWFKFMFVENVILVFSEILFL